MPRRPPRRRGGDARTKTAEVGPEHSAATQSNLQPPTSSRPQQEPDEGYVAVGRVLAPFGVKGEVKVQPLTDNADRFVRGARLLAGCDPVFIATVREAQGFVYLTFEGVTERIGAERFRHALLQVPESALPPLAEGEYYRFQLIGLTVVTRAGATLGTLEEIIETGANDVYRVRTPDGADVLLPALDDVVLSVDLDAKRMVVDPPAWR